MKPRNFPERRRQRQLGALERIRARYPNLADAPSQVQHEAEVLAQRAADSKRHVRTKKNRSVGA